MHSKLHVFKILTFYHSSTGIGVANDFSIKIWIKMQGHLLFVLFPILNKSKSKK